ncbi:unnamed protein product [Ilex paraguariensis]|uniref:Uncharacterized protein n=1 Tax=Ilex paraguariensis TaxID=185542 RepID=A0ABC8V1H5_9AQUA
MLLYLYHHQAPRLFSTNEGGLPTADPSRATSKEFSAPPPLPTSTLEVILAISLKPTSSLPATDEGSLLSNTSLSIVHVSALLGRVYRAEQVVDDRLSGLATVHEKVEE